MKAIRTSEETHERICKLSDATSHSISEICDLILDRGLAEFENDHDGLKEIIRNARSENEVVIMSFEATDHGISEYNKFLKSLTREERRALSGFISEHKTRAENITYNENKRRVVESLGGVYDPKTHGKEV